MAVMVTAILGEMMSERITDLIGKRMIFIDGAMGTEILAHGLSTEKAELLNITNPDIISKIHNSYILAGADIITTNTFGANRCNYPEKDFNLHKVIASGVEIAKKCAKGKYVAYSCGPLGELLKPFGKLSCEQAYDIFCEQAKIVDSLSGVDLVIIETMTELLELKTAILAFKENTSLPIFASMSFDENGRTYTGVSLGSFALTVQGLGVDAIGLNCGTGPDIMRKNIKELINYTNIPVFASPNAGLPKFKNGKTVYDMSITDFTNEMKEIAKLGVSFLGGCCGTNAEFIKKTIDQTNNMKPVKHSNEVDAVCSYGSIVRFLPTVKIGERVNPTGRPMLKKALLENDIDFVASMCSVQQQQGADILDLNVGMSGIDEGSMLAEVVKGAQAVCDIPLQLDSSRSAAIENALRVVNGLPIINSVNGDKASMEKIFPLAKKYGAYVVALCLDENGVPESAEARINIAKKIITTANTYGIGKNKLLFDALTLAISVDSNNANITKNTTNKLSSELSVKTILGLSNVSFGLPAREKINGEFYRQLQEEKVTAVIIDPLLEPTSDVLALDALTGKDIDCKKYIEKNAGHVTQIEIKSDYSIKEIILNGLKSECKDAISKHVTQKNYLKIIETEIVEALNILGDKYERGIAFLPQLISGAECAKAMLADIKEKYMQGNEEIKAVVLLATVKGDVHDIGKNIVKAVLGNYGYKIIDLGRDVGSEVILENLKKYNAKIVGLSALMTTTLDSMEKITHDIKNLYTDVIVMVGGAVVTQSFCDKIGADIYCKDAQEAVKKLSKIVK